RRRSVARRRRRAALVGAFGLDSDRNRAHHRRPARRQGLAPRPGIPAPRPRREDRRMTRRLPITATLIVALAVAVMIGLGVWQLQRAKWKETLLARYEQAGE